MDGSEPVRPEPITRGHDTHEERRTGRTWYLGTGSMACPACDAPVVPHRAVAPADDLTCPVCFHFARVRDFLSLAQPTRPARVDINIRVGRT
jgi:hypothetical protein